LAVDSQLFADRRGPLRVDPDHTHDDHEDYDDQGHGHCEPHSEVAIECLHQPKVVQDLRPSAARLTRCGAARVLFGAN
jgi:hypothetical protein